MPENLAVRIVINAKDRASSVFRKLSSTAAKVSVAIVGFFAVRFFGKAIEDAKNFEQQMDTVAAVSGITGQELEKLSEIAKQMGATTTFSAIQAAGALESLGRAGLSASEQAQALPSVLALAQANGLELGEAASFITKAIAGMGLEFSESARVADVLTKAAASTNTNVQLLGAGLSFAAPLANTLGVSLEETTAILGQFSNAGIVGTRAGTALNRIMIEFENPASKFRKELAGLGINSNKFTEALAQLAEKGDQGKAALRSLGSEASPAIQALFNQGVPQLQALTKSLDESGGAAKKSADIMTDNVPGALKGLGSVLEAVRLQLAEPLLEPLSDAITTITKKFQELVASGDIAKIGQSIADSFSAGVSVIKSVTGFIAEYAGAIKNLLIVIAGAKFAGFISSITATGTAATTAAGGFNRAAVATKRFGVSLAGIGGIIRGGLYGVLATEIFKVVGAYQQLQTNNAKNELLEVQARENRQLTIDKYREIARELGIVAFQYGISSEAINLSTADYRRNIEALGAAIEAKRNEASATQEQVDKVRDFDAEINNLIQHQQDLVGVSGKTVTELTAIGSASDQALEKFRVWGDSSSTGIDTVSKSLRSLSDVELKNLEIALQNAFDAGINKTDELKTSLEQLNTESLERAFKKLGLTSTAALQKTASEAKKAFDIIKASGKATTSQLSQGFAEYARKAIAANGGVESEALKTEAAFNNVKISAKDAGQTIVSNMGAATESVNKTNEAVKRLTQAQQEASGSNKNQGGVTNRNRQQERADRINARREEEGKKPNRVISRSFNNEQQEKLAQLSPKQRDEFNRRLKKGIFDLYKTGVGGSIRARRGEDGFKTVTDAVLKQLGGKGSSRSASSSAPRTTQPARPAETINVNIGAGGATGQFTAPNDAATRAVLEALRQSGISSA